MRPLEMSDLIGQTVLVTTENWFFAPDGRQYRAVFGTLVAVRNSQEALGIKVSARSQDWYMTVGNMKIAGCQINYMVLTNTCERGRVQDFTQGSDKGVIEFERPSSVFFADGVPTCPLFHRYFSRLGQSRPSAPRFSDVLFTTTAKTSSSRLPRAAGTNWRKRKSEDSRLNDVSSVA